MHVSHWLKRIFWDYKPAIEHLEQCKKETEKAEQELEELKKETRSKGLIS